MRLSLKHALVIAVLGMPAFPAGASAQVVFDNGVPDQQNGFAVGDGFRVMNDFVLGTRTSLLQLNWYAFLFTSQRTVTADYVIKFMSTPNGPTLGVVNVTGNVATQVPYTCCGDNPYEGVQSHYFHAFLGGFTLDAGTYWAEISEFTSDQGTGYWASSQQEGNQLINGNGYENHPTDMEGAFNLTGYEVTATPEPAAFVMLGTGLIGLVAVARRRKARQS